MFLHSNINTYLFTIRSNTIPQSKMATPQQSEQNLKEKGNQLFKQGHYSLASALYRRYLSKPHPDNKNAYHNLALCCFKMQKYQECIEACHSALDLDPEYAKVYFRLAHAFQKMGEGFEFRSYMNAQQFCFRNRSLKDTAEWKQMNELRQRMRNNFQFSKPIPIKERNNIFYPNFKIEQQNQNKSLFKPITAATTSASKDKESQKSSVFKGYSWKDVKNKIESQLCKQALDAAYQICRRSSQKDKDKDREKLLKVKAIVKGTLPKNTQLQIQQDSFENKQQNCQNVNTQKQITNQVIKQEISEEDLYEKYFKQSLQKKLDLFEGFPTVIISIVKNEALNNETKEQILLKASDSYPMFGVLQMSLSSSQKQQIKQLLNKSKLTSVKKLIEIYCN